MHKHKGTLSWVFKWSVLVFIFGIFPIGILALIEAYGRYSRGEVAESIIQREIASRAIEDGRVMSQDEASTLQHINESIVGLWENKKDPKSLLQFRYNNTFNDFYDNRRRGFGTWRAYSAVSRTLEGERAGEPSFHIEKVHYESGDNNKKQYTVKRLDDSGLLLVDEKAQSELVFVRATTSSSTLLQLRY